MGAWTASLKVLLSSVTEPLRARARPCTVASMLREMDVVAKMLPTNWEYDPRVAELPTCQNTLHACALLTSLTLLGGCDKGGSRLKNKHNVGVALGIQSDLSTEFKWSGG